MNDHKIRSESAALTPRQNEKMTGDKPPLTLEALQSLSVEESNRELQGLHLHLVELERENKEQRQELEALRTAHIRWHRLFDRAPVGCCTLDERWLFVDANQTLSALLNIPSDELVAKPIAHFIVDQDQDLFQRHGKVLTATGKPQTCNLRMLRHNSSPLWVQLNSTIDHDTGGTSTFRLAFTDISRQKKIAAVIAARLRLKELVQSQSLIQLLQATVDEAEALTESQIGFYHLLGQDLAPTKLQAWSTNTLQHICKTEEDGLASSADHADMWRELISKKEPIIHNDSSALPQRKGLPPGHPPVFRELVVPVVRRETVVALLGVGNKLEAYNEQDVEAVTALADLVWDISRHRQTKEALQDSNTRLQTILHSINAIIYIADMATYELLFINTYGLQTFGKRAIGRQCWEVLQGLNGPCPFCTNEKLIAADGRPAGVYRWQYQNNINQRWYEELDHTIQWTDGRVVRMSIATDITEQKKAEEALWDSERRRHQASETANALLKEQAETLTSIYQALDSIGLIVCDLEETDSRIRLFSAGAEKLFGWQQDETIGKSISLIYPEENIHMIPDRVQGFHRGKSLQSFDMTTIRRSGERFPVVVSIHPFDFRDGRFRKSVGVFRDISELIWIQQQLKSANENLEKRVELRTKELQETQKQFLHAEKLSAIGKLSASIAHEFNNPLQGILAILKGLQKRAILEEEDRELLNAAIDEGHRMKSLIHNLQDFNRPSSGRKVLMDIHASLDATLLLHKSDFKGKKISVDRNYTARLPHILAVPDQIRQVFLNLLANAADACQESGGVITISTRHDKDSVAIIIKDSGIGIQPGQMPLIFQPFYTTKPEVKGTGLGLPVSYGIIKNHGGEILVESLPGAGSTFTIYLPVSGTAVAQADKR